MPGVLFMFRNDWSGGVHTANTTHHKCLDFYKTAVLIVWIFTKTVVLIVWIFTKITVLIVWKITNRYLCKDLNNYNYVLYQTD